MSVSPEIVTAEMLVSRARDLAPGLGKIAVDTERERSLPPETFQAFKDAGLLRAFVPKIYGGYELDFGIVIETTREVGEHCGSSAWCLAICTLHNRIISTFPVAAQQEVFGESPDAVVCGVFMPGGRAHAVDGGYQLTGQWSFASSSDHASHAILAGLILEDPHEEKVVGMGNFLVRRENFSIDDNWIVSGLEGTGSKRVIVEDVFVPVDWMKVVAKDEATSRSGGTRGENRQDEEAQLPMNSTATLGLVGVPLGIARGAIASFEDRLASKIRVSSYRDVEAQVAAQLRLSESAAEVDGAELIAMRDAQEMVYTQKQGVSASLKQRGRYRRDAAYIFNTCAKAVARLMPAGGAHGIYREAPLQRAMRDTQVMATHIVADWDLARETYARTLLGLPISDSVF